MTPAGRESSPEERALRNFVASTRAVLELLDGTDIDQLGRKLAHQTESFAEMSLTIQAGTLPRSSALSDAIELGRQTAAEASRRMQEIRGELEQVRQMRSRTSRRRVIDTTAHFVSRRV